MIAYTEDDNSIQYYDGSQWQVLSTGGDITAVVAGNALTGGGTEGSVTLNVDESAIEIPASQLSDVDASASELNILDGATVSTTALNSIDNGTSGQIAVSDGTNGVTFSDLDATPTSAGVVLGLTDATNAALGGALGSLTTGDNN